MARIEIGEHLDPTAELTLEVVKQRAVKGVAVLTGRTVFLQAVTLVATFLLTVFLSPAEFGVFFLVSAVINFFAYFSDIGLAAALIQKKDQPTREEFRTTFAIQQGLASFLILIILVITPLLKLWYGLSQASVYLLWALTFSLFLSSLKTIPSVLLERKLEFNKLIIPQIVETILFYLVAVYLAWRGFGITSFTIAILVRGIAGLVLIYILQPWLPGLALARGPLLRLLGFGLPYQVNTFLAAVKDDGMTAFLGGILGPAGIGFLSWAQKWAQAPLRFFMDQVIKVSFPAFSRLQDNKEELSRGISRSILFICLFVFPTLVGLALIAPPLVELIPRYDKWQPALLALTLVSINSAWAAVTTPLTNLLNAIGKITVTFRLMLMWTALTWLFLPALAVLYGVNGAAAGFAIVGTSSFFAIWWATQFIKVDLWANVIKPLIASGGMGVVVWLVRTMVEISWVGAAAIVIIGIISYLLFVYLLFGESVFTDVKRIYETLRNR